MNDKEKLTKEEKQMLSVVKNVLNWAKRMEEVYGSNTTGQRERSKR